MASLYKVLVTLPSKAAGVSTGSLGVLAAFWPTWLETSVGAKVTADTIQLVGMALMALSIVYFALLWFLKPTSSDDVKSPDQSRSLGGRGSANFAGNHGPITFNHYVNGEPERAKPKPKPKPKPKFQEPLYSEDLPDGPSRALTSYQPKPNFPLNGVLVRVYKSLGGMPPDKQKRQGFQQKVDLTIADSIVEHKLSVWGRIDDRPRSKISASQLRNARFRHVWKFIEVPGTTYQRLRYTDLMFNKEEIDQVWPSE